MKDYPPAHVIHEARCPDAPPGLVVFHARELRAYPTSRPHRCFTSETVERNREVVAETVEYEPHRYEPSTLKPADATRALCSICRGTHGDSVPLDQFLGFRVTW